MITKFWILGCICCMACGNGDDKPDHILSKDKMVSLMIDLHVAQTRVHDLSLRVDSTQKVYDLYQEYLLEEHNIDDSTFYESMRYYLDRPIDLNMIHEAVLDTLNLRLQKIEALEEQERKNEEEKDSLENLDRKKDLKLIKTKES